MVIPRSMSCDLTLALTVEISSIPTMYPNVRTPCMMVSMQQTLDCFMRRHSEWARALETTPAHRTANNTTVQRTLDQYLRRQSSLDEVTFVTPTPTLYLIITHEVQPRREIFMDYGP